MHLVTGLLLGQMFLEGQILSRARARGAPFELVHVLPGRVRVRVHALKGNPTLEQQITTGLGALTGVTRVQADLRTGSVLVRFDETPETRQALIGLFQKLSAPAPAGNPAARALPAVPLLRQRLQELGQRANSGLMQRSNGATDLTTLLGAVALAWGLKTLAAPVSIPRWQGLTLVYWGYNLLRS